MMALCHPTQGVGGLPRPSSNIGNGEARQNSNPQPRTLNLAGELIGDEEEGKRRRNEIRVWELSKMPGYGIAFPFKKSLI